MSRWRERQGGGTSVADFYGETLARLGEAGLLDRKASVLVVCGGEVDARALAAVGFSDVTISNLDDRMEADRYAPFAWSFQDAEDLDYPDGSFDYVLVHAGLHHCASPHKALTEMYRVARRALVVFESRDSAMLNVARRLGLVSEFEIEAVAANGMRYGGVRNSAVPNFVYRWTEREVEKTLRSFDPTGPARIEFFYGLRLPEERLAHHRNPLARVLGRGLGLFARAASTVAPRQGNLFAFYVAKAEELWPWLARVSGEVAPDEAWFRKRLRV